MQPPTNRINLLLLGTVEIRGQALDSEALGRIQPKRTALLAYLAMAGGAVRRDTLRALFWPELNDLQARRALNQAVFHLRRSLGDDALESGGMESVALNAERLTCDAPAFEDLCRAGRLAEAMELYRGPFAAGFHVGELPDLEHWIDSTRGRLAACAFNACSALAADATDRDPRAALQWARRAYEIDQSDAAVRRVIALHDALGDRAAAIREYEQFARRIEQELDVEPSPETQRLVDEIRARAEPMAGAAPDSAGRPTPIVVPVVRPIGGAPVVMTPLAAPPVPPVPRSRAKRSVALFGTAIAAVLLLTAIVAYGSGAWRASPADAGTLTSSREARAAYVAGERDLAAGRFESAVEGFRRAVVSDSTYAMAQYRLSIAANWTGESNLATSAAAHAQQLSTELPARDRTRIDAWVYYLSGQTDEAGKLYSKMLAADPNDFDAAFYSAEIQFHWGPSFGSPAEASAPAWDRVLALDPANAGALIHRLRIAAMELDSTTFESLAGRLAKLGPSPDHQIEVRALRAFTFGDSASRAAAAGEIASVDALRHSLVHEALLSARNMNGAAKLLIPTLFIHQTFSSWEQGEFLLGAQASVATGHIAEALATVDSAASLQPDRALEYRAMIASIPGVALPAGERAAVRRALDGPLSPQTTYNTAPATRDYFAALLAVRDGELPAAHRALNRLIARSPRPGAAFDTTIWRHVDRLSRIAAAEIMRAEGKPDSALVLLGKPVVEPDRRIPYVWSYPRAEERLLRAELSAETGKLKDALAWYSTFPDPGTYDLAYLPLALERRTALADQLGDTASARVARARLTTLGGR
jgi:DNA-binding SARP family transcriptional activator